MQLLVLRAIFSALFGLIFGVGLILAGMTNPARVVAFLDVAGDWDPSLAFVMATAILVAAPAFAIARHRTVALLGEAIGLPNRFRIDSRLMVGAALFGVGWGLSGICPGPGVVLLGTGGVKAVLFAGAVILGMWLVAIVAPPPRDC